MNPLSAFNNLKILPKLIVSFVFILIVASIPALLSLGAMGQVTSSGANVIQNKIPQMDAMLRAKEMLTAIGLETQEFLDKTEGLEEAKVTIMGRLNNLELLLDKVEFGSDSKQIKDFIKKTGVKDVTADLKLLPAEDPKLKKALDEALKKLPDYRETLAELLKTHVRKVEYVFTFDGKLYNVRDFASMVFVEYRSWASDIDKAIKYDNKIEVNTIPEKAAFVRWAKTFKTSNSKITKGHL